MTVISAKKQFSEKTRLQTTDLFSFFFFFSFSNLPPRFLDHKVLLQVQPERRELNETLQQLDPLNSRQLAFLPSTLFNRAPTESGCEQWQQPVAQCLFYTDQV